MTVMIKIMMCMRFSYLHDESNCDMIITMADYGTIIHAVGIANNKLCSWLA